MGAARRLGMGASYRPATSLLLHCQFPTVIYIPALPRCEHNQRNQAAEAWLHAVKHCWLGTTCLKFSAAILSSTLCRGCTTSLWYSCCPLSVVRCALTDPVTTRACDGCGPPHPRDSACHTLTIHRAQQLLEIFQFYRLFFTFALICRQRQKPLTTFSPDFRWPHANIFGSRAARRHVPAQFSPYSPWL